MYSLTASLVAVAMVQVRDVLVLMGQRRVVMRMSVGFAGRRAT